MLSQGIISNFKLIMVIQFFEIPSKQHTESTNGFVCPQWDTQKLKVTRIISETAEAVDIGI